MSSLVEMARLQRLRHRRARDGETIIPGRRGFIYRHSPDRLGWALVYTNGNGSPTAHLKEAAKKDPKIQLYLEGDEEAIFLFDTEDLGWVARRWCHARRLPGPGTLSDEQRRAVIQRTERFRFRSSAEPA